MDLATVDKYEARLTELIFANHLKIVLQDILLSLQMSVIADTADS